MAKAFGNSHVMKVCNADELEDHTSDGWELQEVLPESRPEPMHHEEQDQRYAAEYARSGYSNFDQKVMLYRPGIVATHRFLLRKRVDTRLSEVNAVVDMLRGEKAALEAKAHASDAERDVARQNASGLERRLDQSAQTLERVRMDLAAANQAKQKMEADLAAIRKDIGEAAMRRILDTVAASAG